MLRGGELHPAALGISLLTIIIIIAVNILAYHKNRSLMLATLCSIVPVINIITLIIYFGLPVKNLTKNRA